jgi:hypothetical protein
LLKVAIAYLSSSENRLIAGVGDLGKLAIAYLSCRRNRLIAGVGDLLDENHSHHCSGFGIVRGLRKVFS